MLHSMLNLLPEGIRASRGLHCMGGTEPVSQKGKGEGERRIWSGGVLKGAFHPLTNMKGEFLVQLDNKQRGFQIQLKQSTV